jgi:DNA-binding MarR family transcriptional regulator
MAEDEAGEGEVRLGALAESLGFLLRIAQLRSFDLFFEALGDQGIRPGEATILMVLAANPGIRQGALGRTLMIKRAHMTKMVQAMEQAGLVSRSVPEDDRRSVELRLTDLGEARVAEVRAPIDAYEARPTPNMTEEEAATLRRLLRRYAGLPEEGRA